MSELAEPEVMVMLLSRQPSHLSEAERWRRAAAELKRLATPAPQNAAASPARGV